MSEMINVSKKTHKKLKQKKKKLDMKTFDGVIRILLEKEDRREENNGTNN